MHSCLWPEISSALVQAGQWSCVCISWLASAALCMHHHQWHVRELLAYQLTHIYIWIVVWIIFIQVCRAVLQPDTFHYYSADAFTVCHYHLLLQLPPQPPLILGNLLQRVFFTVADWIMYCFVLLWSAAAVLLTNLWPYKKIVFEIQVKFIDG